MRPLVSETNLCLSISLPKQIPAKAELYTRILLKTLEGTSHTLEFYIQVWRLVLEIVPSLETGSNGIFCFITNSALSMFLSLLQNLNKTNGTTMLLPILQSVLERSQTHGVSVDVKLLNAVFHQSSNVPVPSEHLCVDILKMIELSLEILFHATSEFSTKRRFITACTFLPSLLNVLCRFQKDTLRGRIVEYIAANVFQNDFADYLMDYSRLSMHRVSIPQSYHSIFFSTLKNALSHSQDCEIAVYSILPAWFAPFTASISHYNRNDRASLQSIFSARIIDLFLDQTSINKSNFAKEIYVSQLTSISELFRFLKDAKLFSRSIQEVSYLKLEKVENLFCASILIGEQLPACLEKLDELSKRSTIAAQLGMISSFFELEIRTSTASFRTAIGVILERSKIYHHTNAITLKFASSFNATLIRSAKLGILTEYISILITFGENYSAQLYRLLCNEHVKTCMQNQLRDLDPALYVTPWTQIINLTLRACSVPPANHPTCLLQKTLLLLFELHIDSAPLVFFKRRDVQRQIRLGCAILSDLVLQNTFEKSYARSESRDSYALLCKHLYNQCHSIRRIKYFLGCSEQLGCISKFAFSRNDQKGVMNPSAPTKLSETHIENRHKNKHILDKNHAKLLLRCLYYNSSPQVKGDIEFNLKEYCGTYIEPQRFHRIATVMKLPLVVCIPSDDSTSNEFGNTLSPNMQSFEYTLHTNCLEVARLNLCFFFRTYDILISLIQKSCILDLNAMKFIVYLLRDTMANVVASYPIKLEISEVHFSDFLNKLKYLTERLKIRIQEKGENVDVSLFSLACCLERQFCNFVSLMLMRTPTLLGNSATLSFFRSPSFVSFQDLFDVLVFHVMKHKYATPSGSWSLFCLQILKSDYLYGDETAFVACINKMIKIATKLKPGHGPCHRFNYSSTAMELLKKALETSSKLCRPLQNRTRPELVSTFLDVVISIKEYLVMHTVAVPCRMNYCSILVGQAFADIFRFSATKKINSSETNTYGVVTAFVSLFVLNANTVKTTLHLFDQLFGTMIYFSLQKIQHCPECYTCVSQVFRRLGKEMQGETVPRAIESVCSMLQSFSPTTFNDGIFGIYMAICSLLKYLLSSLDANDVSHDLQSCLKQILFVLYDWLLNIKTLYLPPRVEAAGTAFIGIFSRSLSSCKHVLKSGAYHRSSFSPLFSRAGASHSLELLAAFAEKYLNSYYELKDFANFEVVHGDALLILSTILQTSVHRFIPISYITMLVNIVQRNIFTASEFGVTVRVVAHSFSRVVELLCANKVYYRACITSFVSRQCTLLSKVNRCAKVSMEMKKCFGMAMHSLSSYDMNKIRASLDEVSRSFLCI